MAANKALRFSTPPPEVGMSMRVSDVNFGGTPATPTLTWQLTFGDEDYSEVVREYYEFAPAEGRWKVSHNRFWLIRTGSHDDLMTFDSAHWQLFDEQVELAKQGDTAAFAQALMNAMRFREARQLLAAMQEKDAALWAMEAGVALLVGDVKGAKSAACTAKRLGAASPTLPDWTPFANCGQ